MRINLLRRNSRSFHSILLVFVYLALANSTLSKNGREGRKKTVAKLEVESEETTEEGQFASAEQEGEVDLKKNILMDYDELDVGERRFKGEVTLGYVTVWNNHGYDVAKWAARKFTHLSPVWFKLASARVDGQLTCKLEGTHDIDKGWIEDVIKNNTDVKIVPRFLFEGWKGEDLKQFLTEEQAQYRCVKAVIHLLLRTQMDGAVVEIWLQILAMTRGTAIEYTLEMIEFWAKEFHKAGLLFIMPLTPPLNANLEENGLVNRDVLNRLLASVDFLNLMTYDFPSTEVSGVAPLYWVEANIRYLLESAEDGESASKVLMGLNFYGYDRTGGGSEAILGKKYIEVLSGPDSVLNFDTQAGEHRLTFGQNGLIYFPTILSIQMRLDLARKLGVGGVAIWDLGQGLDHFTSVL